MPPVRSSFLDRQQGELFQSAQPDKKNSGTWLPDPEAESELVTLTGGVSLSTATWQHRSSKDTDMSAPSPSLSSASSFQSLEEYEPSGAFSAAHDARSDPDFEYGPDTGDSLAATTSNGFSPSVVHTTLPDNLLRRDDTDLSASVVSEMDSNVLSKAGTGPHHMGGVPSGTVAVEGGSVADMVQLLLEGEASIRNEGTFVLVNLLVVFFVLCFTDCLIDDEVHAMHSHGREGGVATTDACVARSFLIGTTCRIAPRG